MKYLAALLTGVTALFAWSCAQHAPAAGGVPSTLQPPPAPREFRGVWVASVGNINWPKSRDMSVEDQKKSMIEILDRAVDLRLNAIIFQVRTQCDALYESKLEPWSEYLTGTEGKAPEPYYDPLQMWVEEAHKRGLELHAWFNPYRARAGSARGERASNHVSNIKPQIVRTYGNQLWLDPGDPETINHSLAVFLDVVKRYDIDGVHIDDYFYPYKISEPTTTSSTRDNSPLATRARYSTTSTGPTSRRWRGQRPTTGRSRTVNFPDDATWAKYRASGGALPRNDWRRQNVNTLIQRLYAGIHAEKKWVKFGISPFGIWRPGNPPGISGLDSFDQLYADSKVWLNRGWCDYFTPQLYWGNEGPQAYPALFNWWSGQNQQKRFVWPGLSVGRRDAEATIKQIQLTRQKPNPGNVHWSYHSLIRNEGLVGALKKGVYAEDALVPASRWLDAVAPAKPQASVRASGDGTVSVTMTPGDGEAVWLWGLYACYGSNWKFMSYSGSKTELELPRDENTGKVNRVVVTAMDRCGNESDRLGIAVEKE